MHPARITALAYEQQGLVDHQSLPTRPAISSAAEQDNIGERDRIINERNPATTSSNSEQR